jgi:hypothetical protein
MKELDRRCTRHYDQKFRICDSSYIAGQGWGGLYRAIVDVLGIMIRSLGSAIVVISQVRDGEVFTEHGKVYS